MFIQEAPKQSSGLYVGLNVILFKVLFVRGLNSLDLSLLYHTYVLSLKVILFFRWRGIVCIADAIGFTVILGTQLFNWFERPVVAGPNK